MTLVPTADTKPVVEKGKFIWMNGTLVPWDDARIHVGSHVIHYGSGVFEDQDNWARAKRPSRTYPPQQRV